MSNDERDYQSEIDEAERILADSFRAFANSHGISFMAITPLVDKMSRVKKLYQSYIESLREK